MRFDTYAEPVLLLQLDRAVSCGERAPFSATLRQHLSAAALSCLECRICGENMRGLSQKRPARFSM
jgi:ribosomal protein L34E